MDKKPLHIVSFDNPYPPVYGGVIDVFYKIKALSEQGFAIYLHCIVDSPQHAAPELTELVERVYFYRRSKIGSFWKLFSKIPFAALSRYKPEMVKNMQSVDAPILFEGLQTTHLLNKHTFINRKIVLRLHNLEANYFAGSAQSETNPIRKLLYASEARKYKSYQKIIKRFDSVLTLSVYETQYVQQHYHNADYVPVFHGNSVPADLPESGDYAFYHGDLRLPDNKRAVRFLIDVFARIPDYKLVVASGSDGGFVRKWIAAHPNIDYIQIQNQLHLEELLQKAHLNVMLSFQESGTKLKLVNALYKSRFCIINRNMVDDSEIRMLCEIAETRDEFIKAVNRLKTQPYNDAKRRNEVLRNVLDDTQNALKIKRILEN